jgi:hypothetical protein
VLLEKVRARTVTQSSVEGPTSPWIRGQLWDLVLLNFCWLPLGLWYAYGTWGEAWGDSSPYAVVALAAAAISSWVHRHYTFVWVYGDRETFGRYPRRFVIAPLVVTLAFTLLHVGSKIKIAGLSLWLIAVLVSISWNIWHLVRQRYGMLRIYASRCRGGLQEAAHGRRDQQLLWSMTGVLFVAIFALRGDELIERAPILRPIYPWLSDSWIVTAVIAFAAISAWTWARAEFRAPLTWEQRVPRLIYLASLVALFGLFVVVDPLIGWVCYTVAHSVEYIAFVHHFGQRKYERGDMRGLFAGGTRRPVLSFLLLSGALALFYYLIEHLPLSLKDVVLVYMFSHGLLHFLYDGWIWKVRAPVVRRTLGNSER